MGKVWMGKVWVGSEEWVRQCGKMGQELGQNDPVPLLPNHTVTVGGGVGG